MASTLNRIALFCVASLLFYFASILLDHRSPREGQPSQIIATYVEESRGRLDTKAVECNMQSDSTSCNPHVRTYGDREKHGSDDILAQDRRLLPFVFEPLPLGSIKPLGWLKDQLRLMADGMPGHEYDFYKIVSENKWLGGDAEYSILNEAFPYWFNGLVPLAYALDDKRLKKQVLEAANYIISHQQEDGWLGPETEVKTRNFWGRYCVFLGLAQLVEAEPAMKHPGTILPAMHRFVGLMYEMLTNDYQGFVSHPGDEFDEQWGRSRVADMVLALQWLYEKHPDGNERKIWDCMNYFYAKAYDWSYWYDQDYLKVDLETLPEETKNHLFPYVHVVNVGQGFKSGAVFRRLTKRDDLLDSVRKGINLTYTYHGTPSGSIVGDERISGLSPVRGTELCAVVEIMFSMSYLYQTLGDYDFAERCERAAFNALPVMTSADWWAHQYVAQTNQPISHQLSKSPFQCVGTLGQTFGLSPNYPCCTVNHPQGFPKFLSASYVRHSYTGIAHALLGPAEVNTTTESRVNVHIRCETNYPFHNILYYRIEADGYFRFSTRVPAWADLVGTSIAVNGKILEHFGSDAQTGMRTVELGPGVNVLVYQIGASPRVEHRANQTVAIYHGALQYSVSITGEYSSQAPWDYPEGSGAPAEAQDWTITPTSKWGVAIDPSTLQFDAGNGNDQRLPNPIFAENAPPVGISVLACEIEWPLVDGYAVNPPNVGNRKCVGEAFRLTLKPYGSAKLHMAELPTLELDPADAAPTSVSTIAPDL